MDFNLLLQTGLSRNEALIYLHLAEHGSASPLTLARSLHLPRSTIYSAVETLEGRNLLRREKKSGAAIFKAQDPSALLHTLDKQAREISAKREVTHKVIAELTPLLTRTNYILPKIEVVDGFAKVERFLFDNLERWRDSILKNDGVSWGYQDHTFVEQFSKWIKKAWQVLHIEAGIRGKILSNSSSIERRLNRKIPKREIRIIDEKTQFESTTWVMGDYVVVIMTRRSPIYGFQIHEPLLAANLRILFKSQYDQAIGIL